MIKAKMDNLLVLGIDATNVKYLKDDKPIRISGKELGIEHDILIFYKPTMGDLIKTLQPYLNEKTVIHDGLE